MRTSRARSAPALLVLALLIARPALGDSPAAGRAGFLDGHILRVVSTLELPGEILAGGVRPGKLSMAVAENGVTCILWIDERRVEPEGYMTPLVKGLLLESSSGRVIRRFTIADPGAGPRVAAIDGNRFAVTWGTGWQAFTRVFDDRGDAVSPAVRLNAETDRAGFPVSVIGIPGHGYAAVWEARENEARPLRSLRFFSAEGVAQGGRVELESPAAADVPGLTGAFSESLGLVLAWAAPGVLPETTDFMARRFTTTGEPVGAAVVVDTLLGPQLYQGLVSCTSVRCWIGSLTSGGDQLSRVRVRALSAGGLAKRGTLLAQELDGSPAPWLLTDRPGHRFLFGTRSFSSHAPALAVQVFAELGDLPFERPAEIQPKHVNGSEWPFGAAAVETPRGGIRIAWAAGTDLLLRDLQFEDSGSVPFAGPDLQRAERELRATLETLAARDTARSGALSIAPGRKTYEGLETSRGEAGASVVASRGQLPPLSDTARLSDRDLQNLATLQAALRISGPSGRLFVGWRRGAGVATFLADVFAPGEGNALVPVARLEVGLDPLQAKDESTGQLVLHRLEGLRAIPNLRFSLWLPKDGSNLRREIASIQAAPNTTQKAPFTW